MSPQAKMYPICCQRCGEWLGEFVKDGEPYSHWTCDTCLRFDEDVASDDPENYSGCCEEPRLHITAEIHDMHNVDIYPDDYDQNVAWFAYDPSVLARRYAYDEDSVVYSHYPGDSIYCYNCGSEIRVMDSDG